ncbi:alpha/beta-hydrolase [Aspergillus campestris IBT 28561]|uniref:Alpha/beta-hydrolase n=1 Tax=Aspergillus campestris (strain IBT 28561) TaxID=1392248 RepID=A0A2I1CSB9_ASPC2|nr:alpha/beta-hydrolase [Aspergillus campestris IBT 28561]PKY00530.1 alpha/beta-hydrolase [Aspergillus campestris IBT 28561]
MQLSSLLGVLLGLGLAFAAPHGPVAPAKLPSISSLGTLQALKYNNLGPENNGTAAVVVHDRLSAEGARARCAAIGEALFPLQDAPKANRTDIDYQLDYLVFAHDLQPSDSLWIGGSKSKKARQCPAYCYKRKEVVLKPCDAKLPALCTSNVPPTTDLNRAAVPSSRVSVTSEDYTITGYRDARSFRFLGIPFANPPVKDLRFAPPQPYSGPNRIDATRLADSCIQSSSDYESLGTGISEDCLYLNVYTPVLPKNSHSRPEGRPNTARRPVAVYFYGGAFTSGSASMVDYDGGNFASRSDVVIVTVNYRVGALGWLATGNLTTGNYGTRDQILALRWVQSHIASFGGDPCHVTIFGQSAGGQSVVALLSSTAARGLFSGAIVQSAPLDLPWFTRQVYADIVAPEIAKAIGCDEDKHTESESALLSCLRAAPATSYLDNSTDIGDAIDATSKALGTDYLHVSKLLASIEPLMPMIDDTGSGVIDDQFHILLANNALPNRVPTLFTAATDEAALYIAGSVPNLGATQTGLNLLLSIAFPPDLAKALIKEDVFPINRSDPDGIRNLGADALTHSEWSCPQSHLLDIAANNSIFPSLYEFQITNGHVQSTDDTPEVCSPNDNFNATCHTADVLPVWGTLNSKTHSVDPYYDVRDILHSQLLHDVFGAFLRTRNPNPDPQFLRIRGPAYAATHAVYGASDNTPYSVPEYTAGAKTVSLLGWDPSSAENPGRTEKCRVFREYGFTFENAEYTG